MVHARDLHIYPEAARPSREAAGAQSDETSNLKRADV